MGRSRDIADMLGKTELANTDNEHLITTFDGVDSAYVSSNITPALVFYSTLDSLPVTSLISGQQAYVNANSRLYISDGSGWYQKAFITLSPTMTLDPAGTITLATDGTTTSTVTIIPTDEDTPSSQLSYSVESDGSMLGRAVLSQDSSVFTITPLTEAAGATTGTFTLTFKTTDADTNFATATKDFSLTFVTGVSGSASTISLVKAHGNTKINNDITYYSLSTTTSTGFTEAGDPTAATFSPYRSGGYSTYFDGTGDYLSVSNNTNFAFGTGDFTVEAWVNYSTFSGSGGQAIVSTGTSTSSGSAGHWYLTAYGASDLRFGRHGSAQYTSASPSLSTYGWHHLAVSREGTTVRIFVDGVSQTTSDNAGGIGSYDFNNSAGSLFVGEGASFSPANGYLRDVRIIKGTAQYTSNFTPPTKSLTAISGTTLLACHLPYFADGSTNDHSITVNGDTKTLPYGPYDYNPWAATDNVGSVHLDGTDDDLTTVSSSNFAYGTGDFTWEAWIYVTGAKSNHYLLDHGSNGGTMSIANTKIRYYNTTVGTGSALYTTGGTITYNAWHHIAFVRSSGTTTIYVDGVAGSSGSDGHNYGTQAITVGDYGGGGYNFLGYIADLRILKGTAVYTSAFTPPTEPHTRNSSTQLLMQNLTSISTVPDAGVYDAAAAGRVTLTGNWKSSTATRKFTTSSAYGGTGSLQLNELTPESTGGDFTIQFWLYPAAWNNSGHIFGHWVSGQYHQYLIYSHTGTDWKFYASSNGSSWNLAHTASVNIARWTNSWKHVAMTYDQSAGTVKFWLDGTLASTHTGITGMTSNGYTSSIFSISADQNGGASAGSHYVQDLKISRSVEYTTNFTAPTAEFEL